MATSTNSDKIDPLLAIGILQALHDACDRAVREVGEDMGFTIDTNEFKIDSFPSYVNGIIFDFRVRIER